MKYFFFILICGITVSFNIGSTQNPVQKIDFTLQWDTLRVLKNPYKGWYHHLLDNGVDAYKIKDEAIFRTSPGMDHLYLRLAWSYLEPAELGEIELN